MCHRIAGQEWRINNSDKNKTIQLNYNKQKRKKPSNENQKKWSKNYYEKNKSKVIAANKINSKKRNESYMATIIDFLIKTPCIDCGEKNPLKLTFDHVRGEKSFNISDGLRMGYSLKNLLKEIDKCDVRCFNCHMEKTAINANYITHRLLKERGYFS